MSVRIPAHIVQPAIVLLGALACALLGGVPTVQSGAPVIPTQISQIPLTVAQQAHPQVVIAIGNSESMDGNLSGAIMTGAGSLPAADSLLYNSSSPQNYTIPAGFTPPLNPGNGVIAPYTVSANGHLVDNSPSRLNVAKAGITAMLQSFMQYADFALVDYKLTSNNLYVTRVYEMSPPGGFVFTNTQTAGNRYIPNPCFNYNLLPVANQVYQDCHAIDVSGRVTGSMATNQWMTVDPTVFPAGGQYNAGSSDDPLINDVLYAGGGPTVCLAWGGPNPLNPYTHYSLANYNNGQVGESYTGAGSCFPTTTPTNAGFLPYSPQTMYVLRGFGYGGGQLASSGNTAVPMTTAGANPTPASVNAALAQFTPLLQPETNTTGTTEIKAAAGQAALGGLLEQAVSLFNGNPPSSNGCTATRYVILVTDGLPTLDKNGRAWPPPGTVSAVNWHMRVAFNPDGSLNIPGTNDQAVIDTVNALAQLKNSTSHVKTYVIGLGAGVDPTVNPVAAQVLTAMAMAAGTGSYFPARSPTELVNDLSAILTNVLNATQSTSSVAVNSTGLNTNSVSYLAQFMTSDSFQDWTGNLNAWPMNAATGAVDTTPGDQLWSAQTQLDGQNWNNGRVIATWDPVAKAGTPFRWNPALAPAGISATTALGIALSSFPPDMNGQDVLEFLRGRNRKELRNGGQFRNRTHKLGDIVASAPLYVGAPDGLTQTPDYFSFVKTNMNRSPVIYVGADDGMLHALNPATGNEMFAYIPNGVFNHLINLVSPFYNDNHLFFVNGSPRSGDVKFASDGSWHTVLIGNLAAGGSTLFALDVTAPDAIVAGGESVLAQAALWEFTDTDMGLTFSEPAIANTAAGWMVFAGNGYNSVKQKPVLYGIEPQHGTMLAKIDLCAQVANVCNAGLANGLSSVIAVNSYGEVTSQANVVYAGDLQGNLWRVDISNPNPAHWVTSVIFQARDGSGNIQPITTTPAVTLNPKFPNLLGTMVYIGTGQLLGIGDLTTTGVQSVYGIFDPPTGASPPVGFNGIPTRANNLVQQYLGSDLTVDNVSVRVACGTAAAAAGGCNTNSPNAAANPVQLPTPNRGWFIDLNLLSGERVVTDPEIESGGGLVLTTYQPNPSVCQGGGTAWLMVFNYATGGSFALPELDTNGDNNLNGHDTGMQGGNPVGMSLGPVYASQATLLPIGTSLGGTQGTVKQVSVSSNNVDSVLDRGGAKTRISWWEVRH
ncbi:MAG: pilus assembly protein PilY [Gammaproteobacteria bacterium]|nr:pilus assembly protein PilY [Gammaproteobacteria bacterium]